MHVRIPDFVQSYTRISFPSLFAPHVDWHIFRQEMEEEVFWLIRRVMQEGEGDKQLSKHEKDIF